MKALGPCFLEEELTLALAYCGNMQEKLRSLNNKTVVEMQGTQI